MDKIYIETVEIENEDFVILPLESALVIVLYKYLECPKKITLRKFQIQSHGKSCQKFLRFNSDFSSCVGKCNGLKSNGGLRPPFYVHDENHFISGFSAICREMINESSSTEYEYLLGFNKSCLQSPTETSSWTQFCEISVINAFNEIVQQHFNPSKHIFEIPEAFKQFENHLKKPLKINDKYKKDIKKLKNIVLIDTKFSEYNHPTLLDILLLLSFELSFEFLPYNIKCHFLTDLPLLSKWIDDVKKYDKKLVKILENTKSLLFKLEVKSNYERLYFLKNSSSEIFHNDNQCQKYKQINKVATVQANVVNSLEKLKSEKIKISSETEFGTNYNFDWDTVLREIHPDHGGVPNTRLQRKKEQLKCLVDIVMTMANGNETIVDFCCGSGHLGIILATLLPNCKIIFLENKQFSLLAIKKRSLRLKLNNCLFYQSNIDYFVGKFDIGISLHACGTATDIVLLKCIQKRAKFISCPCCYGSINPMPHISYPLSKNYRNIISERDYLYLTHTADLSMSLDNDIHCMDVIDTDRKLFAEEMGFKCVLSRLSPENCTPKNRILIGTVK